MNRPSTWLAVAAASLSGVCVLVAAFGIITMGTSVILLAPLSALLLGGVAVRAGKAHEQILLSRLWGGVVAGFAGLVAYDLIRLLVLLTGLVPFNPFRPIEVFGLLILDRYEDIHGVGSVVRITND